MVGPGLNLYGPGCLHALPALHVAIMLGHVLPLECILDLMQEMKGSAAYVVHGDICHINTVMATDSQQETITDNQIGKIT